MCGVENNGQGISHALILIRHSGCGGKQKSASKFVPNFEASSPLFPHTKNFGVGVYHHQ